MREPKPLGELLGNLLAGLGVARPESSIAILQRWPELAPAPWDERAVPLSVRDGELVVEVIDGATASLLRYQEQRLIEGLAKELGTGLVTAVKITVSRR